MRGLKLLSEPCFYSLQTMIVFKSRFIIVSEVYEKIWETCKPVLNSNNAINSLPSLQISLEIVALFEKIYYEVSILTVVSNTIVEVYGVKVCRSLTLWHYLQKQGSLSCFKPLRGRGLYRFVGKSQRD